MQLVTVFTTLNPAEADLVRSQLDAAEFDATIANELSSFTFVPPMRGVNVQVPEDQAADARALIADTISKKDPSEPTSE